MRVTSKKEHSNALGVSQILSKVWKNKKHIKSLYTGFALKKYNVYIVLLKAPIPLFAFSKLITLSV